MRRSVVRVLSTSLSPSSPFRFDGVIGSHPPRIWDASGTSKAKLIAARCPATGFAYAGNAMEDLDVWRFPACRAMILVNCPPDVIVQAKEIGKPYVILD